MNTPRSTISLPISAERTAAPRKPMIAKGHDAILKGLQDARSQVQINLMSTETPLIGQMVNRDRYTVSVRAADGRIVTVYKHAIESFTTAQDSTKGAAE